MLRCFAFIDNSIQHNCTNLSQRAAMAGPVERAEATRWTVPEPGSQTRWQSTCYQCDHGADLIVAVLWLADPSSEQRHFKSTRENSASHQDFKIRGCAADTDRASQLPSIAGNLVYHLHLVTQSPVFQHKPSDVWCPGPRAATMSPPCSRGTLR